MKIIAPLSLACLCSITTAAIHAQTNLWQNSGNIGIGTLSPSAKLHIGQSNQEIRFDYNGTDSYYGSLRWAGLQFGNNGTNRVVAGRTQPGGLLDFYVNNTNDGADYSQSPNGILAMRMASNGNIGIGTTSPSAKLDIGGPTGGQYGTLVIKQSDGGEKGLWLQSYENNNAISIYHTGSAGVITTDYTISGSHGPLLLQTTGGNVGIGTTNPSHKLSVNGTVRAREMIVDNTNWSDYVFADNYKLQSLAEVEAAIKTNKHLPGVPSAQEVSEKGVSIGDIQAVLLAKIEELTLHVIAQQKELGALRAKVTNLENNAKESR
jgi:hypothetical protein